ncbi:histone-lysine N-methyltransferase ASHH3 isoform X2 [Magnolia sinica]|uniref:histone-lysine N-methyltransferase ASHH3 isoform X2 n=1 Tax=Magnolia sinica TaxID=86752 RepID=UPI002659B442|nr:histone-lysine N-methyltransferase ASHH3 isoform X2 [Magnolia sinica]XP_058077904.1 histone-lysine N-methyltransferase ASHH3 isoform X2 [Magnolia sinica]XP_058077905.1 histone-lysine N-methyltransferase ASHH3 isoform X2 [Magnolia sinica]
MDAEHQSSKDIFNKMMEELELESSPVDFQLPNWLKKRKPMHYTFIRRNVYLTKKVKKRIEDDGIFCSCSPSSGSSSVCGRDCHCGMLLSSCSTSCKCGNSCLNKPFQHRKVRKLKLVKTEKCGSGLVADEDIKQGEFVIEYVGEVIDDKTCEERLWKMKHRGETNFYLCEINRDMVIDATYKGNKSRFINHSCQPNTEMQKWRIDGETRIGIFATRDIKRGEDLTYDYQFVQFGADQDCYCGALGCRQKLGTKPSKLKTSSSDSSLKPDSSEDFSNGQFCKENLPSKPSYQGKTCFRNCIGEFVRIWRPHEQRFYIGCVKHFDSNSREHTIISEDRCELILDMSKEVWEFY